MDVANVLTTLRERLSLFVGGSGGIDNLLGESAHPLIAERLSTIQSNALSCSNFNQLLALAHQPAVSEGFFRYYWLSTPPHFYDVTDLENYHDSFRKTDCILTLDQFAWGLYRIYVDSLLVFGSIQNGFKALARLSRDELEFTFALRRYDHEGMMRRGAHLPLNSISQDERYLIAEQACKTFDPIENDPDGDLLMVLRGAWIQHARQGGGPILFRELLARHFAGQPDKGRQKQFEFSADEILDVNVSSEEELLREFDAVARRFSVARSAALQNTDLYLSTASDLDVYVATSMRSRQQFRDMAKTCEFIFSHDAVRHLHLRYFDPTLSAAAGHEDKGLIECLMVKCAKALIYMAGEQDSYGKDAEAAMALSLGRPVIFLCDESGRRRFFSDIHPLSRLIDFQSGVAVGAMATSSPEEAARLLGRIFENRVQYILEHPKPGYFRLREKITNSVVRVQTNNRLLRETFWNCYHQDQQK